MDLEEVKLWLRIDHDEEDGLIEMLIESAKNYFKNATGYELNGDPQAKLFCLVLITDWYENRDLVGHRVSEKVRFTIQSMLTQLTYSKEEENV